MSNGIRVRDTAKEQRPKNNWWPLAYKAFLAISPYLIFDRKYTAYQQEE